MTTRRLLAILLTLGLLASACGGGSETTTDAASDTASATAEPTAAEPTATPTATETEEAVKAPTPAPPVAEPTPTAVPAPPTAVPTPTADAGAGQFEGMGGSMGDVSADQPPYESYVDITDDTGAITVSVPLEWAADVDGAPYTDDQGRQLFDVRAAPDLEDFATSWTTPGVIVTASREVAQTENEVSLLDELVGPLSGACTYLGREPYADAIYVGQFDVYDACGGEDVAYVVVGAVPSSRAFVIRVQVQVNDERDLEALDRVLQSFEIVGEV